MAEQNVNLDRIGGVQQSGDQVVDTANHALRVNVVAGGGGGGGGPATIADGADVAQGAVADVAVTSDVNGTLSAKLRGLVKIFADIWDSVNHRFRVDGSGVTQPVSGTFWQATQPVSGTVTTTPPANASTNIAQVGAVAVSLGAKSSANSIPVVLASDEAALPVTGAFFQTNQPVTDAATGTEDTLAPSGVHQVGGEDQNEYLRPLSVDEMGYLQVNQKEVVQGLFQILMALTDPNGVPLNSQITNKPIVTPLVSGTLTDRSGTITSGGTSQLLAPANPGRVYLTIQNPTTATEPLYVNFTSPASTSVAGSISLVPGGSITMTAGNYITTETVNIAATTAAHAFTAKEQ